MRGICRLVSVAALAAFAFTGCTSATSDDASSTNTTARSAGGGGAGKTTGITDTTLKLSVISADLAQLTEQNLAPEIGNARKTIDAVVADVNAKGGVGGRKVEVVHHELQGVQAILNPDLGRQACIQATEDDKPFAVIITASLPATMVQCAAVDHDPLTITMDSWPKSLYDGAQGRLFSLGSHISIQTDRAYRAWPKALDDAGLLKGKKIGIIRQETAAQAETVDGALKPALEALGYQVAAEAVLPCPEGSQTCEQHQVAIQRMQDAGVDTVFLVAQTLAGSATVEAAQNLNFKPQWMTTGNNITSTVAKFFKNAKANYDGAYGLDTGFTNPTPVTADCNRIAVAGGAKQFPTDTDGYSFTADTCLQVQELFTAIESVKGTLDQASVIGALEALQPVAMISGPQGSLSKDKHDAGTAVFLSRYSAQSERFEPIDSQKPIQVTS